MSFKLSKSRSLSIGKGKVVATKFSLAGQAIPTVIDEPLRVSAGCMIPQ